MKINREYQAYKNCSIITFTKHKDAKNYRAEIASPNGIIIGHKTALSKTIVIKMAKYFIDQLIQD